MSTAHEIALLHAEGSKRIASLVAQHEAYINTLLEPWLVVVDQHLKREARQRYYLRHRLVRLLRRHARRIEAVRAYLNACARIVATPNRRWSTLEMQSVDAYRYFYRSRIWSAGELHAEFGTLQSAKNYAPTTPTRPHGASRGLNSFPHGPHHPIGGGGGWGRGLGEPPFAICEILQAIRLALGKL